MTEHTQVGSIEASVWNKVHQTKKLNNLDTFKKWEELYMQSFCVS